MEGEAEVKRRLRRDRNRLAATKYREAREKVLSNLEEELRHNQTTNDELTLYVERLLQRKQQLEFSVSQIMTNHPEPVQSSSEIVHPITSSQTFELVAQDQEQFQMFLTNSSDAGNSNDFHLNYQLQQQEQQQQMTINSSSLNRYSMNVFHQSIQIIITICYYSIRHMVHQLVLNSIQVQVRMKMIQCCQRNETHMSVNIE